MVFCVADSECPGETHVSFDFNTVLEDSRREKEVEKQMANGGAPDVQFIFYNKNRASVMRCFSS